MIQSCWLNTVAGDSATRARGAGLTIPLSTDRVGQARRNRTVGGGLAGCSGGLSSRGFFGGSVSARMRSVNSGGAARFLLDLSVSRSSSRRNHVARTRTSSSSKSCDGKNGKLHHGRCRWTCSSVVDYNRSVRVIIICLLPTYYRVAPIFLGFLLRSGRTLISYEKSTTKNSLLDFVVVE